MRSEQNYVGIRRVGPIMGQVGKNFFHLSFEHSFDCCRISVMRIEQNGECADRRSNQLQPHIDQRITGYALL